MEDPAAKIKQLSDNLQQQQTRTSKKKEEMETLNKSATAIEKELQNLRMQFIILQGEQENKKAALARSKEELKKKIDHANRIISADKGALEAQKSVIQPRLDALQAEVKKAQDNKNVLLKSKQGDITAHEESKANSAEEKKDADKEETFESLTKAIKVDKDANTGLLTVATITGIVEACITLAGKQFGDTVRENRRKLRANKNLDVKAYLEQAGNELNAHSEFFKDLEAKILKELAVDKSLMDKSIEYYISAGNFEVIALMNLLGERFKSFIMSSKKIDTETFKEILKFKNDFVEKEAKNIFGADNKRIIVQSHLATVSGSYAQKEEMSLSMLRNYFEYKLGNAIAEKFGVEEEDIREAASNPEVQYDMEIASLSYQGEEILFKQVPELAAAAAAAQQQGGHY